MSTEQLSDSMENVVYAVTSILLAIGILAVALRCYVRIVIAKCFGRDDYMIILTLVLLTTFLGLLIAGDACIYKMLSAGAGYHMKSLPEPELSALAIVKWNTIYQVINVLGAFFTKLSIAFFILRLQNTATLTLLIWLILTPLALSTIVLCFVVLLQCIPLVGLWTPMIPSHCISSQVPLNTSYVQSGFAIITDVFLTASPIVILWKVQISSAKKLAICGLMSLGLMATVANALRNAFIPNLKESDITYTIVPILLVADLEFNLGVIAACIPTLMPLFHSRFQKHSKTYSKMLGPNLNTIGSRSNQPRKGVIDHDRELSYSYKVAGTKSRQEEGQKSDSELPLSNTSREGFASLQIPYSMSWNVDRQRLV
ncbi:integral membrane protein [Rutstroemia sp. NJR-2017a WRK4]|nr:integral membrane protein [Rutstroemia sp. NJR-2017a WRK4]